MEIHAVMSCNVDGATLIVDACAEIDATAEPSDEKDISWDIDITEAAEQADDGLTPHHEQPTQAPLEHPNMELLLDSLLGPRSVLSLTNDSSSRTALLDDLYELNAFLLQQIQELAAGMLLPTSLETGFSLLEASKGAAAVCTQQSALHCLIAHGSNVPWTLSYRHAAIIDLKLCRPCLDGFDCDQKTHLFWRLV